MNFQKSLVILFTLIFSLSSQMASAASLQQAKADGFLGEQTNGYLGFANPGASSEIKKIMVDVNSKRRTIYAKLATKQGISLGQVENVAGARNIKKTTSGNYIQDRIGNWVKVK